MDLSAKNLFTALSISLASSGISLGAEPPQPNQPAVPAVGRAVPDVLLENAAFAPRAQHAAPGGMVKPGPEGAHKILISDAGEIVLPSGEKLNPRELVAAIEPKLRGEKLTMVTLDDHGKVVAAKEIPVPADAAQSTALLWGIFAAGLATSAVLSGLSIGLFSVSKLHLTLLSEHGDEDAKKILNLRQDSNTVLSTLIWGNVATNVLLSRIGDQAVSSTLGTVGGMLFSIGAITLFGEILPQSYFSQNVLKVGAKLEPLVQLLRFALYPVAKPSGMIMDRLVGKEGIQFFEEKELQTLLKLQAAAEGGQTGIVEATGASNFLSMDDLHVAHEGELVAPKSIITIPFQGDLPVLPSIVPDSSDPFLNKIQAAGVKWVIFCDEGGVPRRVLDADSYLRDVLFEPELVHPNAYWHKPVVVSDPHTPIGEVLGELRVRAEHHEDDVVDNDLILMWTKDEKRIITGSDLLGRLLRGIVGRDTVSAAASETVAVV